MHHASDHAIARRPVGRLAAAIALLAALGMLLVAGPASAHGFSSTVYVEATATATGFRADLDLEYDLLVVSAAENEHDDAFFDDGMSLFETGSEAEALNAHTETVVDYVTERFTVSADGVACTPGLLGDLGAHERDGVPYAQLALRFACPGASGTEPVVAVRSTLFPDDEGYVTGTETILEYAFGDASGSAALNAGDPEFSTGQAPAEHLGEFFLLGAEHLLSGADHLLFLLALIVGSRRLRDVVLAATSFTIAHSVTFLLAAVGVVSVPASIVEPIIALSIAVVALVYLWQVRRQRGRALVAPTAPADRLGLTRTDRLRLAVVFGFGLIHGLGFAGALGIDEPWSWALLGSLLVFNVGIEAVQIAIILVVFPVLAAIRSRTPRAGLWAGVAVSAAVALMGLAWFVERLLGLG
ncbi:HupE / UreJ protein [Agromyces sp. CF514]|uniref:HupE/UreJ family protein n=1 Tax=Agromyces sp. CF514 TaxID=1881031 RepID=UPI0008E022D0|nr:HupE/UreJ family protein [Agromyces sp. CF514]SFR70536.1 HupE / UreJ protein [Agromyces sp. CF514]